VSQFDHRHPAGRYAGDYHHEPSIDEPARMAHVWALGLLSFLEKTG
jgi:hypothetical protein